jgi:hypothetical protein
LHPEFDDRDPTRTLRYPLPDLELVIALTQVPITRLSDFGEPICEIEIYECGHFQWRAIRRDAMVRRVHENPHRDAVFDVREAQLHLTSSDPRKVSYG